MTCSLNEVITMLSDGLRYQTILSIHPINPLKPLSNHTLLRHPRNTPSPTTLSNCLSHHPYSYGWKVPQGICISLIARGVSGYRTATPVYMSLILSKTNKLTKQLQLQLVQRQPHLLHPLPTPLHHPNPIHLDLLSLPIISIILRSYHHLGGCNIVYSMDTLWHREIPLVYIRSLPEYDQVCYPSFIIIPHRLLLSMQ